MVWNYFNMQSLNSLTTVRNEIIFMMNSPYRIADIFLVERNQTLKLYVNVKTIEVRQNIQMLARGLNTS